jgi:hypothetical protein
VSGTGVSGPGVSGTGVSGPGVSGPGVSGPGVADLIAALRTETMTLAEVAAHFRRRAWARSGRPEPRTSRERAEQLDPGLPVPGSIDEVTAAYDRGQLTADEYDVLAAAVADALRTETERGAGGPPTGRC